MAEVVRRGRPIWASAIKLFVRGRLPTDPGLLRFAFARLLDEPTAADGVDPLDQAEAAAGLLVAGGQAAPFLSLFTGNLRRHRELLELGAEIPAVARDVLASMALIHMGVAPASAEAALEMSAAFGKPVAESFDEDGLSRAALMGNLMARAYSMPVLQETATQAPLEELLALVPAARHFTELLPRQLRGLLGGQDVTDGLIAMLTLGVYRLQEIFRDLDPA